VGSAKDAKDGKNNEYRTSNRKRTPHPGPLPVWQGEGEAAAGTRGSASLPGSWSQCMRRIERRLPMNWGDIERRTSNERAEPSPPHEPGMQGRPPHPIPLPQGGEGEDEPEAPSGSGAQCAILSGKSHPDPLPSHQNGSGEGTAGSPRTWLGRLAAYARFMVPMHARNLSHSEICATGRFQSDARP